MAEPPRIQVRLNAVEVVRRHVAGEASVAETMTAALERIAAQEPEIHAWAHLSPEAATRQASALDARRGAGLPLGPLHGAPVGVKDIVDTADLPTEYGSPLEKGRQPRRDATLVTRLKAAGAVIAGKTTTTEFAYMTPGPTTNPHDLARTPGGSSSGSAAAVAAGMVPAAIGTQTNGSVVRPAAFCGVVGFKPTFGRIPRTGVLDLSRSLDQVGVFARTVEDVALIAETLMGSDGEDPAASSSAGHGLFTTASSAPPLRPTLAFVKTPAWERAEPTTREAFAELVEALGDGVDEVALPEPFNAAIASHRVIMAAEMTRALERYVNRAPEKVSDAAARLVEEGRSVSAVSYLAALGDREMLNAGLDAIFARYDAIVTPAAPGEAPIGMETTGDPSFCTLWSYCGTPAITLPLMTAPNGLPLGVQLVGPRDDDARLLRTAWWLVQTLANEETP